MISGLRAENGRGRVRAPRHDWAGEPHWCAVLPLSGQTSGHRSAKYESALCQTGNQETQGPASRHLVLSDVPFN